MADDCDRDQHRIDIDDDYETASTNAPEDYHEAQEYLDNGRPAPRRCCQACWTSFLGICSLIARRIARLIRAPIYTLRHHIGVTNGNLVYFIIVLSLGGVLSLSVTIHKPVGLDASYTNWFFVFCMGIAILWMLGACACRNPPCGCCLTAREEGTKIPCYMIIGLTIFCIGSCFITGVDLMAFLYTLSCKDLKKDSSDGVFDLVKIVFLILQLHFFCRFSDVNFYRRWCTSFFIIHIIAVNLSTWFYYIVDESVDQTRSNFTNCSTPNDRELNDYMGNFVVSADLYLYPFNIEYTVMSSVLLLLMWFELRKRTVQNRQNQNADNFCCTGCCSLQNLKDTIAEICHSQEPLNAHESSERDPKTMLFWKSAVIGYIIGVIVLAVYLVLITLSIAIEYDQDKSAYYYYEFRITLFTVMFVSSICGLVCLPKSHSSQSRLHTRVDSILIMIGVTGCYVMVIFEVISAISDMKSKCNGADETASDNTTTHPPTMSFCPNMPIYIGDNIVALFQFSFQAIFIVKALRRRQDDVSLAAPTALAMVRNTSAILSLGNLGIWALDTFELKNIKTQGAIEVAAYGRSTWKILSHIAYPLCIFFRLHSAFCFFEIVINRFGVTARSVNGGYSQIRRQRTGSGSVTY
ncbi:proton channel OTOP2 [Exaiptasia diaphana]|uniref:Uncharacterized protein n=1 Tax=Exaiptasia diaphana TaxID=2652724 RepID=A0A913X5Q6_EXADI|nr:proton channel OTOP2 [Exaiptasia diaphana]KXJ28512.1 Otopetrin-2 [Exaiptasia diaphana]